MEFDKIGKEIGELVNEKNAAYGNSFEECSKFLSITYPNGVKPHQYTDMLAIVRVFDKIMRIAHKKDAFGESPWRDIVGYGLLAVNMDNKTRAEIEVAMPEDIYIMGSTDPIAKVHTYNHPDVIDLTGGTKRILGGPDGTPHVGPGQKE